jgi:hypothetical protein
MYEDAAIAAAPFVYKGTAYCKRHLILTMQDKPGAKLKWSKDKA